MNVLAAAVNRGLRKLEAQLGAEIATMTWRGTEFACVRSTEKKGLEVVVGGSLETVAFELFVRIELMPPGFVAPNAARLLTYQGVDYRIATVSISGPGSHYQITLVDKHAG